MTEPTISQDATSGEAGEMVEPSEPGGFVGDIFFGHPEYSTMGTHRWDGEKWERLRSEVEVLCDLLAAARNERDNLRTRLSATDTEAMRQALLEARDAADEVLAPLCEKVGRYLYDEPETDAVETMHDYDVVIPFSAFKRLYDATDKDRIDALAKGGA